MHEIWSDKHRYIITSAGEFVTEQIRIQMKMKHCWECKYIIVNKEKEKLSWKCKRKEHNYDKERNKSTKR